MKNFDLLVKDVYQNIKEKGYSRSRTTLFKIKGDNYGIINFQKSSKSTSENVVFTLNVGVCIGMLRDFFNWEKKAPPHITDCQWIQRIGNLMPNHTDYWWTLTKNSSVELMVKEIVDVLERHAISEIAYFLDEENLEKFWLEGNYGGLTQLQRYINLTALLKIKKDPLLPGVVDELRMFSKGKSFAITANEHLKDLGF